MKKVAYTIYALYCLFITGIVMVYFVGFYQNVLVPKTISDPNLTEIKGEAVILDFGLLLLFGLQHSIMARTWFKKRWELLIPPPLERSTYLLLSSLVLAFFVWKWQPFGGPIWDFRGSASSVLIRGVSFCGLLITLIATTAFDLRHFVGWKQRKEDRPSFQQPKFSTPLFYQFVRHPIYFGFILSFWATPLMTWSHLFFAIGMTAYIFIGATFEERNLLQHFGKEYLDYQQRVPMLVPFLKLNAWKIKQERAK